MERWDIIFLLRSLAVNSGEGDKTFQFNDASDAFKANISLDVASGEVYKINGTEVLSSDTLGSEDKYTY